MNLSEPSSIDPLIHNYFAGVQVSQMVIYFIILAVLLIFSAFASGSESAFFSIGPKEKEILRNEEAKSSKQVLKLLENPKELLAVLLITNNFVNVGIAIISSVLIEMMLGPANKGNETLRFLIEVIGITFTMLMLGEVIPKIYSSRNSVRTAKLMAFPISTFKSIPPISWLKSFLVHGTNLIQKNAKQRSVKITSDELEHALALTKEESTSEEEHKILEGIVKFGNTEACQVMRSRMDVVAIDENANYKELLELILDAGYSRVPVFNGSIDNVTGILYIKDLLPHLSKDESFKWQELTRKPFFIPENKKIDDLLKEFQEKKMHMAVVVDEYGGASGIVTLEDVLEEIVGDITDEFDEEEIAYTRISENTFLFEGRTTLVDFYKVTEMDGKNFEQNKGDSETLSGFLVEQAGRILKNNEYVIFDNVKMIVESSDKRRIKMIKVILLENQEEK
ncbi:MAG: gliding motility-associated protein GldE [Flavobacteriia bacterium]